MSGEWRMAGGDTGAGTSKDAAMPTMQPGFERSAGRGGAWAWSWALGGAQRRGDGWPQSMYGELAGIRG